MPVALTELEIRRAGKENADINCGLTPRSYNGLFARCSRK